MSVVAFLTSLDYRSLPPLKKFALDDFQRKVRGNIFIEIPLKNDTYCLLSPAMKILGNSADDRVRKLVSQSSAVVEYFKERLMQALVIETALLETSTYFVEQNGHLLLARLNRVLEHEKLVEINLYTATAVDLSKHYSDKIYIGRCFIKPEVHHLPYDGLNFHVLSLIDQFEALQSKAKDRLSDAETYRETYFCEIRELLDDVVSEVISGLENLPPSLHLERWGTEETIRVKALYRGVVHMFVELLDEVGEFESVLMHKGEDKFVRYVTKYRQDLKNIVNYLNFNVLSPLSQHIHRSA